MARSFSEAELATLATVAETFVHGDGVRRAGIAAEAIEAALDPAQVRQLRLALRLFENRPANLALGAGPVRFSDLSPADRERYLLRWAYSRLAMRRSAFAAYRRLLSFIAYADPGQDGSNPRHATIGYFPTYEPVTSDPTPIRPAELPGAGGPIDLDADVVVVGSGAGGGVVAAALAEAGRSVVVLEAGPFIPESAMPTDELAAYERMYLDRGMTATWDGAVTTFAGSCVGGGTTVNWMTSIATPDAVREEWASVHGLEGLDGDGFMADLRTIETEIELSPPPNIPPKDAALRRGATHMGYQAEEVRRNGSGCGDCGTCPFGCRIGAKRSGLRAHLARAHLAGALIVPDAPAWRAVINAGGVTGVEATVRGSNGADRELVVRARQVVVAAGALRTPAVLDRSGLRHPAIGRHLRLHPVCALAGRFAEPIEMWRWTTQAINSGYEPAPGEAVEPYAIESVPAHPGLLAASLPWEGSAAAAAMLERVRWLAPLIAITRDSGEGRVSLTRAGRVRLDYDLAQRNVATLRHALVRMARIARAAGAQQLVALGTPPAWHGRDEFAPGGEERAFRAFEERLEGFDFGPNRGSIFSAHQMGSARAGSDPRDYPCDPWGRVRAGSNKRAGVVRGLYVADGSLFPTGIGVNPQVTIMALARRVARTVIAESTIG